MGKDGTDIVYRKIGDCRYDVYIGKIRVGWVIRVADEAWKGFRLARNGGLADVGPVESTRKGATVYLTARKSRE